MTTAATQHSLFAAPPSTGDTSSKAGSWKAVPGSTHIRRILGIPQLKNDKERKAALDRLFDDLRLSERREVLPYIRSLEPKDRKPIFSDSIFDLSSPAQGYEGVLNITLDGTPVRTSLPAWTRFDDTLITTTYKGATLTIGYDSSSQITRSSLRWYGQLILVKTPHNRFKFHLDVTNGRPVNPLSPTRAGLIQDAAYHELLAFVKDQIFSFVLNPANRAKITPAHVEECFSIDALRTIEESPYITTRAILPINNPSSIDDCEPVGDVALFTYEEAPVLVDQTVIVLQDNQTQTAEFGISSFAPLLKNPHTLRHGDSRRLRVGGSGGSLARNPRPHGFSNPANSESHSERATSRSAGKLLQKHRYLPSTILVPTASKMWTSPWAQSIRWVFSTIRSGPHTLPRMTLITKYKKGISASQ